MKVRQDHFNHLKTCIEDFLSKNPNLVFTYEQGKFSNAFKVNNLQKRFNWDILYMCGLNKWICDNLYSYCNDSHIDTVLNHICPKLEKRY